MLSHLAHWILVFALAMMAQASIPGWTSAAVAASVEPKKCTAKSHQHGKVAAKKPTRGGGGAGAQIAVPRTCRS